MAQTLRLAHHFEFCSKHFAPKSFFLLLVVGLDVAAGNADITSVHARSESEKAHVTNHIHHAESHVSPQAAKALPERLWRVCDVEEHERLGAFAAQAARKG